MFKSIRREIDSCNVSQPRSTAFNNFFNFDPSCDDTGYTFIITYHTWKNGRKYTINFKKACQKLSKTFLEHLPFLIFNINQWILTVQFCPKICNISMIELFNSNWKNHEDGKDLAYLRSRRIFPRIKHFFPKTPRRKKYLLLQKHPSSSNEILLTERREKSNFRVFFASFFRTLFFISLFLSYPH